MAVDQEGTVEQHGREEQLETAEQQDMPSSSVSPEDAESFIPQEPENGYLFKTGDQIAGRFEVVAPLGFGGFSEVYRCRDMRLGRDVSVKVLIEKGLGLEEARAAARLDHPQIVPVYDVLELKDGTSLIVFRYVAGETLEARLNQAQYRRLTLDAGTLRIVRQISEALDYAHGQKVIHRDIKPSNIILDHQGSAYLTDFGLAGVKRPGEKDSALSEDVERLSGTIPYMAPEQIKEGKPGDERSDLYSLGVVVYEVLTGQLPYRGRATQMMAQILISEPLPPVKANPELPQGIEPVLLRALDKDPEKRYPSCLTFARELEDAAGAYVKASTQYGQAKELFEAKRWRQALSAFQMLESQAPGLRDAMHYLEQAQHQVRLLELYEQAQEALEEKKYQGALDTLNVLTQLAPDYEVDDLRAQARDGLVQDEKRSLNEQYRQAVEQFEDERYQACLDTLAVIRGRDPDYPDTEEIEVPAREKVERQKQLRELYTQGMTQMRQEKWQEAIATLQVLHEKSPRYEDIETRLTMARHMSRMSSLLQEARDLLDQDMFADCVDKLGELERVDANYKQHEVARLRKDALDRLHERVKNLLQRDAFEESLEALAELEARSSDYADMEELRLQAQGGIRVRDLRTKLDNLYQQAVEDLDRRSYAEALDVWQVIQQQKTDLDYPDRLRVESQAREGLCMTFYNQALGALARNDPDQALDSWRHVLAVGPNYPDDQQVEQRAQAMIEQQKEMLERQKKVRALAWRIGGSAVLIVLIVLAIMIVRGCDSIIVSPSDTPTWTPTSTQTPVLIPTPTSPPPSDTPAPTPTLTPTRVTPSATATATSTAISTPGPPDVATVIHSSGASIYAAPNSSSQELGGVPSGKQVKVLARSVYGDWLYVRYGGVEGFTYAPRYEWEGDYELLPVKESLAVPAPTSPSSGNALEMDLWDLPDGWCSGGRWYKNVFIQGRGGNGVYTYYWNGERLAGPLTNEGYTFEVYSVGGAVIGTGKVVSGDGQEIERHLYVSVASCHQ